MGIKAVLQEDHIPVNKYSLLIGGIVALTFTKISGIEEEVDVVELPDRTKASGGNTKSGEFTAESPMHHTAELAALEVWYVEGQDPIVLTYKKAATLVMTSGSGGKVKSYSVVGLWISKRKLPDLEFSNEGDMAVVEWTFQYDSVLPI
jgi:hypothetical protein